MTDRGGWILALEHQARRYAVVFLQLGSAFTPLRDDLSDINGRQLSISEYLKHPTPDQPTLHVIQDFERVLKTKDTTIGRLRERVLSDVDAGHLFILVSSVARNAYEISPGSDLLADSRQVFAPLNSASGDDHLAILPSYSSDEQDGPELLSKCLGELGSATVHTLSDALWEHSLSPSESIEALQQTDLEALRGAGFISVDGTTITWTIVGAWKRFRDAVALSSSRYIHTTTWLADTFTDLWVIERIIRNAVRDALIVKQGGSWRETCLTPGLKADVLERARSDAHPSAETVRDLRDPLEWLTTVELLDLRDSRQLGDLGVESFLWTKFRYAVVPIRNRAAHMRFISAQDARTLRTWRSIFQKKLTALPQTR